MADLVVALGKFIVEYNLYELAEIVLILALLSYILWMKIKARISVAKNAHCPSHIYLVNSYSNLQKKVTWGNKAIYLMACKIGCGLDLQPEPYDEEVEIKE